MKQYLNMLNTIFSDGVESSNRTGVNTLTVFGHQEKYDLADGFPLVTTKKVYFRGIAEELLWFLRGETNIRSLQRAGIHIWDAWANKDGELGPIYGHQWCYWRGNSGGYINQIAHVVDCIKKFPESRSLVVSAWNVADLDSMCLPPCHVIFQFRVIRGRLSCSFYQRSADVFLGVPFNIASYALLILMVAQVCNLKPGVLVHSIGDLHLYEDHTEQAKIQLERMPLKLPKIKLNPDVKNIFNFKSTDIDLIDYCSFGALKGKVAV